MTLLHGGASNGIYIIDSNSDITTKNSNLSISTMYLCNFYLLQISVENLRLTGIGTINSEDNSLNIIIANATNTYIN